MSHSKSRLSIPSDNDYLNFFHRKWLDSNIKTANERIESLQTIRADVEKLEKRLIANLKLVSIDYDCAWNIEHIRGCLKSLEHLFKMHADEMTCLNGNLINIRCLTSFINYNILE